MIPRICRPYGAFSFGGGEATNISRLRRWDAVFAQMLAGRAFPPAPGRGEIFVAANPKIMFSSSVRSGIFITPPPAKPKAPDMPPLRGFFVCWDVELQIYRAYGAGMPGSRKCWAAGVSPSPGRGEIFVARNPKIIFSSSVRSGIFVTPPPAKPIAPNIPPLTGLFRLVGCGATNLSHLRRWDAAVGLSGF